MEGLALVLTFLITVVITDIMNMARKESKSASNEKIQSHNVVVEFPMSYLKYI